jgi:single-strand DNA-binding protein
LFQQTVIIGNLGNSPEQRYLPNGTPVTSFSVAVNRTWKDANGATQTKATWFKVSCFRKLAETTAQYLTKGSRVLIVGEMEAARAYTDKSGNPAAQLELTASTVKFLSSKSDGQGAPGSMDDVDPMAF